MRFRDGCRLRAEAGANIVTGGHLHVFFWPLRLGLMSLSPSAGDPCAKSVDKHAGALALRVQSQTRLVSFRSKSRRTQWHLNEACAAERDPYGRNFC